ncbi:YdcF family protein [Candidatus Kaiserbacteria bacterium]|nr:MAG: YdcF family protein [Candidatus Kaiserbacteria bacterium]
MESIHKITRIFVVAVFFLTVATFAYIFSFYVAKDVEVHDCAVVFGAAVWPGGNPSHALSDRTYSAIEAYKENTVSCLVFSGANSAYGKHEVDVMLEIATQEGVAVEDIELDYDGKNTKQTIQNLDHTRSYLLVSNDFHLARINLLARQTGLMNVDVLKSTYRFGRYSQETFFVFREAVAFWYYIFVG